MKIILKKAECLTDWYTIERAGVTERTWWEETGPHSSRLMTSSRIVPSYCVEGTSAEMIELAKCILDGSDCEFRRCAIAFTKKGVEIWSPRNIGYNSARGLITREEAREFAESVIRMLCPSNTEENKYIRCIGVDDKIHVCLPDATTCKCGVKIKRKKLFKNDNINRFSCYECTY